MKRKTSCFRVVISENAFTWYLRRPFCNSFVWIWANLSASVGFNPNGSNPISPVDAIEKKINKREQKSSSNEISEMEIKKEQKKMQSIVKILLFIFQHLIKEYYRRHTNIRRKNWRNRMKGTHQDNNWVWGHCCSRHRPFWSYRVSRSLSGHGRVRLIQWQLITRKRISVPPHGLHPNDDWVGL